MPTEISDAANAPITIKHPIALPTLRCLPERVRGTPIALDNLPLAAESPIARFHENENPYFLPIMLNDVRLIMFRNVIWRTIFEFNFLSRKDAVRGVARWNGVDGAGFCGSWAWVGGELSSVVGIFHGFWFIPKYVRRSNLILGFWRRRIWGRCDMRSRRCWEWKCEQARQALENLSVGWRVGVSEWWVCDGRSEFAFRL